MVKLAACPDELILAVLSHSDQKDLLALSSTCKWTRSLAQPSLYRDIRWTWDKETKHNPPIHLLLRSLLENPNLSSLVELINFQGYKPRTIWTREGHPDLTPTEMTFVQRLVNRMKLPLASDWQQKLEEGNLDAFLALLLSKLANLISFEMGFGLQIHSRFIGLMLKHMLVSRVTHSCFKRLQRVAFCTEKIALRRQRLSIPNDAALQLCPADFDQITPFLYLPCITFMTMWIQNPARLEWPGQTPQSLTLKKLTLHHSEVNEDTLERLLLTMPALEELDYSYHGCSEPRLDEGISTYLDCGKLSRALDCVKSTIRYIQVSVDFYGADVEMGYSWGTLGELGSMRGYQMLERLTVPMVVLLSWWSSSAVELAEVLPPSMRELCLTDDLIFFEEWDWIQQDYLDRFYDYLHDWRRHSPNLERILLRLSSQNSYRWAPNLDRAIVKLAIPPESIFDNLVEHQQELKAMCDTAGVGFKVIRFGEVMEC